MKNEKENIMDKKTKIIIASLIEKDRIIHQIYDGINNVQGVEFEFTYNANPFLTSLILDVAGIPPYRYGMAEDWGDEFEEHAKGFDSYNERCGYVRDGDNHLLWELYESDKTDDEIFEAFMEYLDTHPCLIETAILHRPDTSSCLLHEF
jgi:hypothetical protein